MEKANSVYMSTALRWAYIKQTNNKSLSKVTDTKMNFKFRPCAYNQR